MQANVESRSFCEYERAFTKQEMDGLRSLTFDPPICKNNNGGKPVILDPFCHDLEHAHQFVSTRYRYDPKVVLDVCQDTGGVSTLPVCEYDCEHPTLCIQTGR